jgi:hypothetical protein
MEDRRCKLGLQGRAQSVLLIERAGLRTTASVGPSATA